RTMTKFDYIKGTAFFRDSFLPFSDANLSIASSPVLYGLSVYTVFSLNWNKEESKLYAFRLEDHFQRLISSSKIMDFHSFAEKWDYKKFKDMTMELVKRNGIREDALVRVSIFADALCAGTKIHGLEHAVSAYIYPMGEILPRSGINVCVSTWRRNPDNAIPSRAKVNGGYANVCLMRNEAIMNGYDDAIALDLEGNVTEGTVANLFLVRGGKLITPSANFDILEGITRDSIMKIAKDAGLEIIERTIARSELYIADEVFITGSSARITPILSIDKRAVGSGKIGQITEELSRKYEEAQKGVNGEHGEWRTVCPLT
ncbi:MAG: branched-chain-amino-acid transaminase, partial [bacterium]|nr:branched-chain-amino-acid transaminase [bacterium]